MTIWVIERRVRRKGARWQVALTGGGSHPFSARTAKGWRQWHADRDPAADYRIAKYRRAGK